MKTLTIIIVITCGLRSFSGEIADLYFKQIHDQPRTAETRLAEMQRSRSFNEIMSTNHGITEIGIERTGCFGSCPSYTFVVNSEGSFRYSGGEYAKRVGKFTGTISIGEFHELARFIRDSDYMKLENEYRTGVTDSATTFTMVVMNGRKKIISNYAESGPTKLWAIEHLIDDLMSNAEWKALANPANQKK